MRSAAREGARAHLLVMGMIYAMHIASPIPSKSGLYSSGNAHTGHGRECASKRKCPDHAVGLIRPHRRNP